MYKTAKISAFTSLALFVGAIISFSTGNFYYEGGYLLSYAAALLTAVAFVSFGIWAVKQPSLMKLLSLGGTLALGAAFIFAIWLFTAGTFAGV